jgi:drug/metabolite transporter (DMT)-like permease
MFSCLDAVVKWLSRDYPVLELAFFTSLFAFIPVLVLTMRSGGLQAMKPRRPFLVGLRAALMAADTLLAFASFQTLPLADAYTLFFLTPMLVTALSVPLLKEHVGWRRWTAVVVGFCGVLIILRPGFVAFEIGHLTAIASAVCFSFSALLLRWLGEGESRDALLIWTMVALVLAPVPALPFIFVTPTLGDLALMGFGGLLAGLAQIGLVVAFRMAAPAIVAPFQYTQMIWGVLFGYVVFADIPEWWTLLGSIVIIGSGLYILWRETRHGHRPETLRPVAAPGDP